MAERQPLKPQTPGLTDQQRELSYDDTGPKIAEGGTPLEEWLNPGGIWTQVSSSNVYAVKYNFQERTLEVVFKGRGGGAGSRYVYHAVPQMVARNLWRASSVGKYLNSHIKGRYSYSGPF